MTGRFFGSLLSPLPWALLLAAAGTIPAYAESVLPGNPAHERKLMAESFAGEKLWIWQRRLNLQQWNITVTLAPPAELKPKTLGNIHWDADRKSAVIRVLDVEHYRLPFREALQDMELTILHELLHLELSSLPRSEASRSAEEHAVNQLAEALLRLDRR